MDLINQKKSVNQKLPSSFTDKELYELCNEYGRNAKLWMRKFAVLLPEVFKRNLYRKKGFYTIHEFAAKIAGMNYSTTEQILSLDRCLEEKPALRGLIEIYGWSKIRVVASTATPKTDKFWAEKVKELTKGALELYVRDLKIQEKKEKIEEFNVGINREEDKAKQQTINKISFDQTYPGKTDPDKTNQRADNSNFHNPYKTNINNEIEISHFFPWEKTKPEEFNKNSLNCLTLRLDQDTEFRLRLLRQKLEKQRREPVTFSQVVKFLLDETEKLKENEKNIIHKPSNEISGNQINGPLNQVMDKTSDKMGNQSPGHIPNSQQNKTLKQLPQRNNISRYIPAQTKREIQDKYHGKCAYPNCNKPAEVLHHTKRFALTKNHNPNDIKPLCKEHHIIAHATLIKNEQGVPSQNNMSSSNNGIAPNNKTASQEPVEKNWRLEKDLQNNLHFYSKTRIIDKRMRNFRPEYS